MRQVNGWRELSTGVRVPLRPGACSTLTLCVFARVSVSVFICGCGCAPRCVDVCVHACLLTCVRAFACRARVRCGCMFVCVCASMCVCMCVSMCAYVCVPCASSMILIVIASLHDSMPCSVNVCMCMCDLSIYPRSIHEYMCMQRYTLDFTDSRRVVT